MVRRAFQSELDGMAAAFLEHLKRPDAKVPGLDLILVVARELITKAMTKGIFEKGVLGFTFGDDQTVWFDGWPIGEWVTRTEMFRGAETGDEYVALRIFDPRLIESMQWWVLTEDRLKWEQRFETKRQRRTAAQIERDTVEIPLAGYLERNNHTVKRQVKCSVGRIDIFDLTENEIIECKAEGYASDITAAVLQLRLYGTQFSGAKLALAIPRVEADADWLGEILHHVNIRIVEVEKLLSGERA